jgi:hypothetical protein
LAVPDKIVYDNRCDEHSERDGKPMSPLWAPVGASDDGQAEAMPRMQTGLLGQTSRAGGQAKEEGREEGGEMTDQELQNRLFEEFRGIRMVITARKEAAIAQALAVVANPAMPDAIRQEVRQTIGADFDAALHRLDETPPDAVLEFLRAFQGTVQ